MSLRGPQDVQAFLAQHLPGVSVRLLDRSTATAVEAAAAVGCPLGAIVKSLLFLADGQPRLVLVAGDRKADQHLLAALWGISRKRIRIADPETVRQVTGYEVGGVPPVALPADAPQPDWDRLITDASAREEFRQRTLDWYRRTVR